MTLRYRALILCGAVQQVTGLACPCCGEIAPLQIAHLRGDGAKHREMLGTRKIEREIVNDPSFVKLWALLALCGTCHDRLDRDGACNANGHVGVARLPAAPYVTGEYTRLEPLPLFQTEWCRREAASKRLLDAADPLITAISELIRGYPDLAITHKAAIRATLEALSWLTWSYGEQDPAMAYERPATPDESLVIATLAHKAHELMQRAAQLEADRELHK